MSPLRAAIFATLTTLAIALGLALPTGPAEAAGERFVLKYACYAPEGSTYVREMRAWDAELRERTEGKLSFRIYPGGVQGDERDMIRKMRVGQLHMLGMTGIGLGEVLPAIRVLEMPLYYQDYAEVDAVTHALEGQLDTLVREKGYELLGWGEAGTVHIFSKSPLGKVDDLRKMRMWAWEGDQIAAELFKVFKIGPVPTSLPDVLPSLQAGLIDGLYSSPLGVVALQWSSHLKYMTQQSLGRAMGGTVIDQRRFGALPESYQKLLKQTGAKYHARIVEGARKDNEQAIETLLGLGVQPVEISPEEWQRLMAGATELRQNLTGPLWSESLLQAAEAARTSHRQATPAAP